MKYIILSLSILAFACTAPDPCQNKDLFLQEHKSFVDETIKESKSYSDEAWTTRNEAFEKLVNECYKNVEEAMSKEEKKEFWLTSSKFLAERVKSDGNENLERITDLIESISDNGSGIVNGLSDAFGDDLESTFEEFGNDLNTIFDEDFKEKINEVFDDDFKDDLENALENLGKNLESITDELKELLKEKN